MSDVEKIRSEYAKARERRNALVAEWALRIASDPDLKFHPDLRQRELSWQVFATHNELVTLELRLKNAEGSYVFLGCQIGQHKTCIREITRAGARLVCSCECHGAAAGVDQQQSKTEV
jgi:hypothetical protein